MTKAVNDNHAKWQDFHESKPRCLRLIKHFTFQAIDAGLGALRNAVGTRACPLAHRHGDPNDDGYKINNNHAPFYARLFMK